MTADLVQSTVRMVPKSSRRHRGRCLVSILALAKWLDANALRPMLISTAAILPAQAAEPVLDARVLQLSANISGVYTGAAWSDDAGRRGHYRVVHVRTGWEHAPTAVYLQWVWERESDRTMAVLFTRPVTEVNEAAAWSFGQAQFRPLGDGRVEVIIPAMNVYTLAASTLRLSAEPDGRYRALARPE